MISNHVRHGFRILFRSPFISILNILGLAVGITSFCILFPYAQAELATDQFHKDYKQIARLGWHHRWTGDSQVQQEFYHPLNNAGAAKIIKEEYPEIKDLVRITPREYFSGHAQGIDRDFFFTTMANSGKATFREQNTLFADPNFFTFFSFPLIQGDPSTVLQAPSSAAISERISTKLFGKHNALNQIIYVNDSIPYKITGVFKDLPRNTHLKGEIILSMAGFKNISDPHIGFGWWAACYVKIDENIDLKKLEASINANRKRVYGNCDQCDPSVFIQTLDDIIFQNQLENPFTSKSKFVLNILRTMSFVILAQAWINYVCMSISRMRKRMTELGARKIVGATSKDLITQFLIESLITNTIALLITFTLIQIFGFQIESIFDFYIPPLSALTTVTLEVMLATIISGLLVTSAYPVMVSRFASPVQLFRKLRAVEVPLWMKSLITFQYASTIVLLVSVVTVYSQLDFILNRDIGIDRSGVVVFDAPFGKGNNLESKFASFLSIVRQQQGVNDASVCKFSPGDNPNLPFFVKRYANSVSVGLDCSGGVDEHFLGVHNIKLVAGRNFDADFPADQRSIMISEGASKLLGFDSPDESVGARIILLAGGEIPSTIIGVYHDYEFRPFFVDNTATLGSVLTYKNFISPVYNAARVSLKISMDESSSIMSSVEATYKRLFPDDAFSWSFLDDHINQVYQVEMRGRNQIVLFTILAIAISCLGLFGVLSNRVDEKTREIGIRKIFGARVPNIAGILLSGSIQQLLIAVILALPIAHVASRMYLEKFSERISLHWAYYLAPVAFLMAVLMTTVAALIIKTVRTNPIESLRSRE